jgi:hypothetical protein
MPCSYPQTQLNFLTAIFEFPGGYLHVSATKTHTIWKPHMGSHLYLVGPSPSYRGTHNSRVPGMKSTGHIGRTNKRQHIGVVSVGVKPKTLAHIAVDVNLKGHSSASLSVSPLTSGFQRLSLLYVKLGQLARSPTINFYPINTDSF